MADVRVSIDSSGNFSPGRIRPNPGDTVTFTGPGDDVVLYVDPSSIFGRGRYDIPANASLSLTVREDAEHVGFDLLAHVLEMAGTTRGGGGETGP